MDRSVPFHGGPEVDRVRTAITIAVYGVVFFLLLPAFLWAMGGRLDVLFGWPALAAWWTWPGLVLVVGGVVGVISSMVVLGVRGRGLPISHLPPQRIVAGGPYSYVRHPIYVAYLAAFAGAGLLVGSFGRAVAAPVLLGAGMLVYVLGFEEPKLLRRAGEPYAEYRTSTPLARPAIVFRPIGRLARIAWRRCLPAVDHAANRVVLFRLGPTIWATYGLLLGIGAAAAAALIGGLMLAGGASRSETMVYLASLAAAAVVGGRIAWMAYHGRRLVQQPLYVLRTVGFVSWGSIAAGILVPIVFARFTPHSVLWYIDRTLPGLLAAAVVGRLGCLTYGCCFGRPSPHGVRWTDPNAKLIRERPECAGERRVPTQLLASAWAAFSLVLVLAATSAPVPSGTVAALTLMLYSFGRFAGDCLRDERRFGAWQLTAGQIGSLAAGALGCALLLGANGPPGWPMPGWQLDVSALASVWPAIAASFAIVFLGCGLHWKRMGRW